LKTRSKPAFFDAVQQKAARRWTQLEGDPELAGPWKQLFRQVQSPRHVLSELLQNADDAGATEASVWIENETFIFEHNGRDFSKEDFASLCRFSYSNKRALHTIGFRGIGFKSTFSLGNSVKLFTPSLAVCFHQHRFTEPHWFQEEVDTLGKTRIVVEIQDQNRQKEVEENLQDWCKSPVSLLFFNNIREIKIGDQQLCWDGRPGPIADSTWMVLNKDTDKAYLLIRSGDESFPDEALEEIRQEKMLASNEEFEPPQCKIEIVLGETAAGHLYVVLPTGVATGLPFTCNAPFIQDPARLKIKDSGTSPTNRWLLQRAGKLAASAMLEWLNNADMDIAERARAYDLFPDVNRDDNSLEGVCGTLVQDAFKNEIQDKHILLTDDDSLVLPKEAIAIPKELFEIWSPDVATKFLDKRERPRPALCRHITKANRRKLVVWDRLEELSHTAVIRLLETKNSPKPDTWLKLLNLQNYISPKIKDHHYHGNLEDIRIVSVQGKDVLFASKETVRLDKKNLPESKTDQEFLARHLTSILDQDYLTYLKDLKEENDEFIKKRVQVANGILKAIGLESASPVDKMIKFVANKLFSQNEVSLEECIQIAHIAAKLKADVTKLSSEFKYVTRDMYHRSSKDEYILFDKDGTLEDLLSDDWRETKFLHEGYSKSFESCSQDEWEQWIMLGYAGLWISVPLEPISEDIEGCDRVRQEANKYDIDLIPVSKFPYRKNNFRLLSVDFKKPCWDHWERIVQDDENLWIKITKLVLKNHKKYLNKAESTYLSQISTHGSGKTISNSKALSSWALRLRQLPCLPNRQGLPRKPDALFRLTHETEPLIGVEDFVEASMDNEQTRPLLDLMGVRTTPGRWGCLLLDRLRQLSQVTPPSVNDVDQSYEHLDRLLR